MQRFLTHLSQFWGVATVVRFPLLFGIVFFIATVSIGQVRDLLWLIAEQGWGWPGGFSLLAAATIYAVNVWYWARLALYARNVPMQALTPVARWLENQLPRILGATTYLMLAIACASAIDNRRRSEAPTATTQMWVLVGVELALCVLFYLLLASRRRICRLPRNWQNDRDRKVQKLAAGALGASWRRPLPFRELPGTARLLIRCFVPTVVLAVLLSILVPAGTGRFWGNAPLVLIWGGGFVGVGSALAYFGSVHRLPFLGGLMALALLWGYLGLDANHRIRLMHKPAEASATPPVPVESAFAAWFKDRAPEIAAASKAHPYPVVIVAAAGGGIRAAYWTSYVLARLEDDAPGAHRHILGLSGVSGGSLGIAAFVAALAEGPSQTQTYAGRVREYYEAEFLSPLLTGFLVPDLVQRVLPHPFGFLDRARSFEIGLATAPGRIGDQMDLALASYYPPGQPSPLPYLFFNTTEVQTGLHAVVSPLHLDPELFPRMVDLSCLSAQARLATAVHMSARFPFLSPAGQLPWKNGVGCMPEPKQGFDYLYVDGGYFDNSGTLTAEGIGQAALSAVGKVPDGGSLKDKIGLIYLYIANDPAMTDPADGSGPPPQPDAKPSTRLQDLMAPLTTMLSVRDELGYENLSRVRADIIARAGDDVAAGDVGFPKFLMVRLPPTVPNVPLGWVLSNLSKSEIRDSIDGCRDGQPQSPGNGRLIAADKGTCADWKQLHDLLK
ncbi:MAG TPA: patatin-like phospholipase family protein [Aliidongia sp.]|nr:patatin-like phospholipase family protein [Aliidongia sp.]